MSRRYRTADPAERVAGRSDAVGVIGRGGLVVLPTDTVYGLAADAFTPGAVAGLLAAKGRSRAMPVPVLVGAARTLDGLVDTVPESARLLAEAFWPGALTIVVRHAATLAWDLGDARGTVAVRMPLHPVALELLAETGPLAVSSANRTGAGAPTTAAAARSSWAARSRSTSTAARAPMRSPPRSSTSPAPSRGCCASARCRWPTCARCCPGSLRRRARPGDRRRCAGPRPGRPGRAVSRPGSGQFRMLVVCTGNICRSPMAERMLRAGLAARDAGGPRPSSWTAPGPGATRARRWSASPPTRCVSSAWTPTGSLPASSPWRWSSRPTCARREPADRVAAAGLVPDAGRRLFTLRELARICAAVDAGTLAGAPGSEERGRALVAAAAALRAEPALAPRTRRRTTSTTRTAVRPVSTAPARER